MRGLPFKKVFFSVIENPFCRFHLFFWYFWLTIIYISAQTISVANSKNSRCGPINQSKARSRTSSCSARSVSSAPILRTWCNNSHVLKHKRSLTQAQTTLLKHARRSLHRCAFLSQRGVGVGHQGRCALMRELAAVQSLIRLSTDLCTASQSPLYLFVQAPSRRAGAELPGKVASVWSTCRTESHQSSGRK